jgi:hypothetical protein
LRNVGRGAGIGARVIQQIGGEVFWTEVPFTLASGETLPDESVSPVDVPPLPLSGSRGAASVEPSLVSLGEICVFCFDQLGNGLKLRILGGQPPEVWHPGDTPPDWVNALRDPFDWRPRAAREETTGA